MSRVGEGYEQVWRMAWMRWCGCGHCPGIWGERERRNRGEGPGERVEASFSREALAPGASTHGLPLGLAPHFLAL